MFKEKMYVIDTDINKKCNGKINSCDNLSGIVLLAFAIEKEA